MVKISRTPVWLLTGYLGSGKTTLLKHWLSDPALANAALIVNEIGEVALDDRLLAGSASDKASLIANACVCCTGLPGLEEALAELYWDRLHRRRPRFDTVLIETTGLANPRNVITAIERVPLLAERYQLAGVIATASATAGLALIEAHAEARAQIECADAIVVTKTDLARAEGEALAMALRQINPRIGVSQSARASVEWQDVCALATRVRCPAERLLLESERHREAHRAAESEQHTPHHHASAGFVPMARASTRSELEARLRDLQDTTLLRLKGVLRLADEALYSVQWSAGDVNLQIEPFAGEAPPLGLTRINRTTRTK